MYTMVVLIEVFIVQVTFNASNKVVLTAQMAQNVAGSHLRITVMSCTESSGGKTYFKTNNLTGLNI